MVFIVYRNRNVSRQIGTLVEDHFFLCIILEIKQKHFITVIQIDRQSYGLADRKKRTQIIWIFQKFCNILNMNNFFYHERLNISCAKNSNPYDSILETFIFIL